MGHWNENSKVEILDHIARFYFESFLLLLLSITAIRYFFELTVQAYNLTRDHADYHRSLQQHQVP